MNKTEPSGKTKPGSKRHPLIPAISGNAALQKGLILLLVGIGLARILFPYGAFFLETPPVGSIARKDIRADRDLVIMDRTATEKKKAEILASAEPVFDFDEDMAASQSARLAQVFTAAENALRPMDPMAIPMAGSAPLRPEALRTIRTEFEAAIGSPLTDREFGILIRNRFSPDLFQAVSKLLLTTHQMNIVNRDDFLAVKNAQGIVIRNTKTQKETGIRNPYSLVLREDLQPLLHKHAPAILGPVKDDVRELAVSIVSHTARPNLILNGDATESRKLGLLAKMKPVYIKVQKNELIVREGQSITARDADEIEAFNQAHVGGGLRKGSLFLGIFSIAVLMMIVLYRTSRNGIKNPEGAPIDFLFLGLISIAQMLLARTGIFFAEAAHQAFPMIPLDAFFFAIPFAVGPVLVAVFLKRSTGIVFSIFASFMITCLFEDKTTLFLLSFLGSAVSVHHMVYLNQRSAFYRSGVLAGLVNMLVIFCTGLLYGHLLNVDIFLKLAGGFAGGILSGVIVSGIAPFLESLFGYTTNIKLLELANLNQPLLQRMIVESPGTYHHSIIVASLVEAAAEAIQANSLLAKVSAYYHDIGKLKKPLYFIENQQDWKNKHDKLSPKMSSLVIISHVKAGCDLASRHKLGRTITDIIRQHHGTGIVGYFYEKAQKDKDPSIRSIPESDFRYPGPRPQTKEAGLVLLGDVVEASSRTLTDPTPSRIRNLVHTRIRQIYADGQLDNCELTLRDLNKIAHVFERTLNAIFHQRVDYPEMAAREGNGRRESNGIYDFNPPEKAKSRH